MSSNAIRDEIIRQCAEDGIALQPYEPATREDLDDAMYVYVGDSPYRYLRQIEVDGRTIRVYVSESRLTA